MYRWQNIGEKTNFKNQVLLQFISYHISKFHYPKGAAATLEFIQRSNKVEMLYLCLFSLLLWALPPLEGSFIPLEIVDMTYTFDERTPHWPTQKKFEMKPTVNETDNDGYWLQLDEYSSAVHVGTHVDAPCHFALGKWCVDEIPVQRLSGPAAVVDITDRAEANPDAMVTVNDLKAWETLSGRDLNGAIVVMRTGWGRRWKDKEAYIGTADNDTDKFHFPGMDPKAAQWLVDNRDVHGVVSETLSLDRGQEKLYMSHRILLGNNIFGVENVANVEKIPLVGAYIVVMPMKIGRASGAPARVVAMFPRKSVNAFPARRISTSKSYIQQSPHGLLSDVQQSHQVEVGGSPDFWWHARSYQYIF